MRDISVPTLACAGMLDVEKDGAKLGGVKKKEHFMFAQQAIETKLSRRSYDDV